MAHEVGNHSLTVTIDLEEYKWLVTISAISQNPVPDVRDVVLEFLHHPDMQWPLSSPEESADSRPSTLFAPPAM